MKKPLIDHWWSKIIETGELGKAATKDKLRDFEIIESIISAAEGADVARNVLGDGMIKQALQRCLEIHEGSSFLNRTDLHIYWRYATHAMKEAEIIIDKELSYLDL